MKIRTTPIAHIIKHPQPIFTIDKSSKYIVSGGMNGEVKLWSRDFELVKLIKKHSGSITATRFSIDQKFLATSGDDGKIFILDRECNDVLKTINHKHDITHIEWTSEYLISTDIDGQMIFTKIIEYENYTEFIEVKRIKKHQNSILGLAISPNNKYICSYSIDRLMLHEGVDEVRDIVLKRGGLILENLNSKISFSPNSQFISVGLQFNKKRHTVDIFDLTLNCVYSLVGHVAPSEITCFCPIIFKYRGSEKIETHSILAVASQDLSVSFWSTLNPVPFLVIKNITDQPVLDMFWDGLDLYICSYDGVVKQLEFNKEEFGEIAEDLEEDVSYNIPFSLKNIELKKKYLDSTDKIDLDENLEFERPAEMKVEDKLIEEVYKEKLEAEKLEKIKEEKNLEVLANESRPVRITPISLNQKKTVPIKIEKYGNHVVLYDINLPEKLKLEYDIPFKKIVAKLDGEYLLEFDGDVFMYRNDVLFYRIKGPVYKVCYNSEFLVLYTGYVQIYDIATGCLLFPYLAYKVSFISILRGTLLLVDCYGNFNIFSLTKSSNPIHFNPSIKCGVSGKFSKTKFLKSVELSDKFFILAEYRDGEILSYNKKLKTWISINPKFNSITTTGIDFLNDYDETLNELEISFINFSMLNDIRSIEIISKKWINLILRMKKIDEYMEYKIENLISLVNPELKAQLLQELNTESSFHRFVARMCQKFNI